MQSTTEATSGASDFHAISWQVGGHQGVLTSDDDSLVIKPTLPLEIAFYRTINADAAFAPLQPFVPNFIGTLKLEGELIQRDGNIEPENIRIASDKAESIVLENLTSSFLKPNVMDIKLGTVLYDEVDAPPAKRERMIETARNTTSLETGIRLTGFQVYDNATGQAVVTPKTYGKSINKSQLPEGLARFFPVGSSNAGEPSLGLSVRLLLPILRGIRDDVAEIREVLSSFEVRMVGASILITYEGDWTRAEEALERIEEDDDEDDEDESDDEEKPGLPYVVKLIDFAHTRITPGKGPDEGVLFGLDTLLELIDGRIAQLASRN